MKLHKLKLPKWLCIVALVWTIVISLSSMSFASVSGSLPSGLTHSGGSVLGWTVSKTQISVTATTTEESDLCGNVTGYKSQNDTLTLTSGSAASLSVTVKTISGSGTVKLNGNPVTQGYSNKYDLETNGTLSIYLSSSENTAGSISVVLDITYMLASDDVTISFQPVTGTTYKISDTQVTNTAQSITGNPADGFAVSATDSYYVLVGATLVDEEGNTSSLSVNAGRLYPTVSGSITPIFVYDEDADGIAPFLVGASTYWDYDSAKNAAGSSGTIVLNDDYTLPAGNYEVPDGVTFLIPFNSSNTLITTGNDVLDAYDKAVVARSQYRALKMASNAKITVASKGAICIGSGRANQFIGQVGPYGAIYMESNSNITVESGGTLYAWGYIFHGTEGSGTVTIESGGTVYEPMSIMDYPGSSSLTTTLTDNKVFPMRSYSVRNVEVPMTLDSGAREYVFTCLYGSNFLVGTNPLYALLIANDTVNKETPVLKNSGTITKSYVDGRMCIVIDGDIALNSFTVKVSKTAGTYTVSSSATSGFYIPSCWDMVISSGTTTLNDNVIVCEGSSITINKDATVNANGKNLYVLAAKEDPGAVVNTNGCSIDVQDVHGKYYTNVPIDAIIDVNGTLITSGGFYTSTSGACITSTQGGGVIQVIGTSTSTSVSVKNTSSYTSVGITAAQLKNGDGSYVPSTTGTYTYCSDCMAWLRDESHGHTLNHATNVELGNSLNMYFAFWSDNVTITNGHKVVVSHTDWETKETKTVEFPYEKWQITDIKVSGTTKQQNAYVVYYKGMSAKQMGDVITVTLCDSSGNVVDTWSNSIQHYAMRMLSMHSDNKELCTLIVDMLNYGAACQNQFNYDTGNLVNAGLSAVQQGWATKTVNWDSVSNEKPSYEANLIVDGNIRFAFKNANDQWTYTFTNHWGTAERNGNFIENKSGETYYYINKLYVADARQTITITIGNTVFTDSIAAYCKRMIDSNQDSNGVFIAFMKFSDSAYNYLHDEVNRV